MIQTQFTRFLHGIGRMYGSPPSSSPPQGFPSNRNTKVDPAGLRGRRATAGTRHRLCQRPALGFTCGPKQLARFWFMDGSENGQDSIAEKLRRRLLEKMLAEREALREQERQAPTTSGPAPSLPAATRSTDADEATEPRHQVARELSISDSQPTPAEVSQGALPAAGTSSGPALASEHQRFEAATSGNAASTTRQSPAVESAALSVPGNTEPWLRGQPAGDDALPAETRRSASLYGAGCVEDTDRNAHSATELKTSSPSALPDPEDAHALASRTSGTPESGTSSERSLATCSVSPVLGPADSSERHAAMHWTADTPEFFVGADHGASAEAVDPQPLSTKTQDDRHSRDRQGATEPSSLPGTQETAFVRMGYSAEELQRIECAVQSFCAYALAVAERTFQRVQRAEREVS